MFGIFQQVQEILAQGLMSFFVSLVSWIYDYFFHLASSIFLEQFSITEMFLNLVVQPLKKL